MKREDLSKLGLNDEQIDAIMKLHGLDVEGHKTKVTEMETKVTDLTKQLGEANAAIEGFKKLDTAAIQKAADDWKKKYDDATKEGEAKLAALKFDHTLETTLTSNRAKNVKAVKALLDQSKLKLKDDGTIDGLEDQLKQIAEANDYLFNPPEDAEREPRIVAGGATQRAQSGDAFQAAVLKGAGLTQEALNKGK